ncbi:phosphatidylethanolamine N-methyltransferase /phosphatidyl-N-methylethanolamine N-methyltransferase [Tranquillimonas rosea]|uniref:Phosphatidylethanolamine N-methyltransferase /phosphatidyl-N-methylethanolamine N-methyltransferase n=1 Tax=Tranquillimonas rosea TaxID=641238 RepID=A0A1H9V5B5_9RHOB|nr:class I SAM-dependent methyltransferase [Tranquillimonas rosea]SES16915.1 phosphatidylethanolamine N-methyltransferase /phosphatidyl-N-methylethanolamine N-methyltransferase [Tranquillimonas rosea]
MDIDAVRTSYARWARIYDRSFGAVTQSGRRRAVEIINSHKGSVLELGVGTGLALENYAPHLSVTGVDYSDEMLEKAREKVAQQKLDNVVSLRQMDARYLDFPDDQFDTVAAMHVLSVVPEPERVMSEIARVCRPGGKVVITNHFMSTGGVMGAIERMTAPLTNVLGWHPDFSIETVLQEPELHVEEQRSIPPLGMMTLMVMTKARPS